MSKRRSTKWYADHPNNVYWKKKGDEIWSKLVRSAWSGCAVCGHINMQAHHLLSRGTYPRFRHELINGISLCYQHHMGQKRGLVSAHGSPLAFIDWLQVYYPEKYEWIQEARKADCKRKMTWKESYEYLLECQRLDDEG